MQQSTKIRWDDIIRIADDIIKDIKQFIEYDDDVLLLQKLEIVTAYRRFAIDEKSKQDKELQ